MLPINEQLAHCTVRIEGCTKEGKKITGTGFIFKFELGPNKFHDVVVTNKHVIDDIKTFQFVFSIADDNGNLRPDSFVTTTLTDFESVWIKHPDPKIDLAIFPLTLAAAQALISKHKIFAVSINENLVPNEATLNNLTAVEDILMVGYPNGLWDKKNNLPIFRRGITATHPSKKFNGEDYFVIDAACFPGSSGSPVFLYNPNGYVDRNGNFVAHNRIFLLGVLYSGPIQNISGEIEIVTIPTRDVLQVSSQVMINLGNVVRAERILDFKNIILSQND